MFPNYLFEGMWGNTGILQNDKTRRESETISERICAVNGSGKCLNELEVKTLDT